MISQSDIMDQFPVSCYPAAEKISRPHHRRGKQIGIDFVYTPACDTILCPIVENDSNSCASVTSDVSDNFLVALSNF
ncbi:uncharacterized protein [Blastocystis hominis]|uniref:Uncharacterized protein n=1 Tax=Blastocystis hominis TaxID=12968 RepID=D8LV07_BLAHO|nr:uncharacterized protein [Blastocystis hominis]CBK19646.2 unnamed protein product [Blastocystis hominis]|eukprot:XP_012893694.1 uncharacterized protein [Blastocystis hominis]